MPCFCAHWNHWLYVGDFYFYRFSSGRSASHPHEISVENSRKFVIFNFVSVAKEPIAWPATPLTWLWPWFVLDPSVDVDRSLLSALCPWMINFPGNRTTTYQDLRFLVFLYENCRWSWSASIRNSLCRTCRRASFSCPKNLAWVS